MSSSGGVPVSGTGVVSPPGGDSGSGAVTTVSGNWGEGGASQSRLR